MGSIPACAGEPWKTASTLNCPSVYPRVCGGTQSSYPPPHWRTGLSRVCGGTKFIREHRPHLNGLSPRVRGNLALPRMTAIRPRSIPACAGEPGQASAAHQLLAVYPRVCGGTAKRVPLDWLRGGLSPRVRGNLMPLFTSRLNTRSIPACAGEPHSGGRCSRNVRVYPRVCGGTRVPQLSAVTTCGLSPRVRGNQRYLGWSQLVCGSIPRVRGNRSAMSLANIIFGSIPACAGEPKPPWIPKSTKWVYPRVCGGTNAGGLMSVVVPGLSPRVRGNQCGWANVRGCSGSIPACAGEPPRSPRCCPFSKVYPRVCGGTLLDEVTLMPEDGLSPRVRGNRKRPRYRPSLRRSIPACAGEPLATVMPPSHPISPNYT